MMIFPLKSTYSGDAAVPPSQQQFHDLRMSMPGRHVHGGAVFAVHKVGKGAVLVAKQRLHHVDMTVHGGEGQRVFPLGRHAGRQTAAIPGEQIFHALVITPVPRPPSRRSSLQAYLAGLAFRARI